MITVKGRIFLSNNDNIRQYENNLVTLTLDSGETYEKLEARRLFPVNRPDEYITLLNPEGVEVAVIKRITDLNSESLKAILHSLNDYYLVPHIRKIISITEKYGTLHWVVETERGIKEFDIRNRNHDIKTFRSGCVRVRDSDDNRYVIDDYRALDKHSRLQLFSDL